MMSEINLQKQPPEVSRKEGVLRNFVKFTGKHLRQSLCFNKLAGPNQKRKNVKTKE